MSRSKLFLLAAALLVLPARARSADFLGKPGAAWARDLASEKPEVRRSAAFALGKIGDGAAADLPKLVALIREDRDAGVREAAATAVGDVILAMREAGAAHWGATWPALKEALRDQSPKVKRAAAYAVGAFGPAAAEAVGDLKNALRDGTPAVRQNAAWALGRTGKAAGEEGVDLLCDRLRDDDPLVRRDAATALGDIGLPTASRAWKPLLELVRSEAGKRDAADDVLLRTALGKLVELLGNGNREITDTILPFLNEGTSENIQVAIRKVLKNLGGIGLESAAPARRAVIQEFKDAVQRGDGNAVLVILEKMANLCESENAKLSGTVQPILGLLRNEDPDTVRLAAFALARVGGPTARSAVPVLRAALRDFDTKVQEQAATFIGEMGQDAGDAAADLGDALRPDHTARVRARAAIALAKIGPASKPATKQLVDTLRSEDTPDMRDLMVRRLSAEVFGKMGYPSNRDALPVLLDVAGRDPNPAVRQRCIDVFFFVEPGDFPGMKNSSGRSAEDVLTDVLSDPTLKDIPVVKYDAARALAYNLRDRAPDKTADVLLEMIANEKLLVYKGTDATVTSVGSEGSSGNTRQDQRLEGDARYMAAQGLALMGAKSKGRADVMAALRKAKNDTTDKSGRLAAEAAKALKELGE
jgi:HEAT repeat protein